MEFNPNSLDQNANHRLAAFFLHPYLRIRHIKIFFLVLSFLIFVILPNRFDSANAYLDPLFDGDGKLLLNLGELHETNKDAVLQPDGKFVTLSASTHGHTILTRYNPDGSLDHTFGEDGISIIKMYWKVNAVALQSDGKIVVSGYESYPLSFYDFVLARFHANGTLDTTFGGGTGWVATDLGSDYDYGFDVDVQSDGKIIVAGLSGGNFAVARFHPDGKLDTTFNGDGIVTTHTGSNARVTAVAIQADGKIIVAGSSISFMPYEINLVRYNPDGSLDTSFDGDGIVITPLGSWSAHPYAVALQPDGKIIVVGEALGTDKDFALVRYHPDGSLDATFDGDGKVSTNFGVGDDWATAVTLVSDSKIMVAGQAFNGTDNDFALARYNQDGSLDSSFSADGLVTADLYNSNNTSAALLSHSSGQVTIAGMVTKRSEDPALLSFDLDGNLDNNFGINGSVVTDFGLDEDEGYALEILPDSDILVAGWAGINDDHDFAVARVNPDGSLDTSFGEQGSVLIDFGTKADEASDIAVTDEGKIILVGKSGILGTISGVEIAIVRLLPDGNLDTSFGLNGKMTTDFPNYIEAHAVAIQSNGKILVAGSYGLDFFVLRFTESGALDSTFATNGIVVTDFFGYEDQAKDLALQSDGKIVVAGYALNGHFFLNTADFAIARYNTDGTLDNSFGGDGKVTTNFVEGRDMGEAVTIQPDGKILVAGSFRFSGTNDFGVARYHQDGSLDASFGGDGKVTTDFASRNEFGNGMVLLPDGRIALVGYSDTGDYQDFAVAVYHSDGSLDTTFSFDGKDTTGFGYGDDFGQDIAVQSNGKLVAVGTSTGEWDNDIALARYSFGIPEFINPIFLPIITRK